MSACERRNWVECFLEEPFCKAEIQRADILKESLSPKSKLDVVTIIGATCLSSILFFSL